jgi:hypothetical protein
MLTNESKKQIFDGFGSVNVTWENDFNGFPCGSCIDHSWAGLIGWTEHIVPFFLYQGKLIFGEGWDNTIYSVSNNGQDGGTNDSTKEIGDFPGDYLLLGYCHEGENHEQNATHDPESKIVLFRNISTCDELAKEIKDKSFKVWCEKLEEGE